MIPTSCSRVFSAGYVGECGFNQKVNYGSCILPRKEASNHLLLPPEIKQAVWNEMFYKWGFFVHVCECVDNNI